MKITNPRITLCGISFDYEDRAEEKGWLWFEDRDEVRDFIVQLKQILTMDEEKETR